MNLGNATGHPSFVMSNSFTNQTLAQIALWNEDFEVDVHVLPKHLDEKVARLHLQKTGVELEELTEEQSEYIGVPKDGPYEAQIYRYYFHIYTKPKSLVSIRIQAFFIRSSNVTASHIEHLRAASLHQKLLHFLLLLLRSSAGQILSG